MSTVVTALGPEDLQQWLKETSQDTEARITLLETCGVLCGLTFERKTHGPGLDWLEWKGPRCVVYIEVRPDYCNRGAYKVLVEQTWPIPEGMVPLTIDGADGFPRYYFHPAACATELRAWLTVRGELP